MLNISIKENGKPDFSGIKSNYENLNPIQKFTGNLLLMLRSIVRADIHRCPNCHRLTMALTGGATAFGWHFFTKCHRCGHEFEWDESV